MNQQPTIQSNKFRHESRHFWKQPAKLTIFSAAFFFGWILVVPFEGQVLRGLMERENMEVLTLSVFSMGIHLLGLLTSALMVKSIKTAHVVMITAIGWCLAASLLLFVPLPHLWHSAVLSMAYVSGLFVAAWGVFLKEAVSPKLRYKAVIDVLVISNVLMILIDITTINWQVRAGKLLALLLLVIALTASWRLRSLLEKDSVKPDMLMESSVTQGMKPSLARPFAWLCLFIMIITLNSGLMYQVVMPSFFQFPMLTSIYWAIPYIAALLLLRNLPQQVNRAHTLYLALAMMGLGYLLFMRLPVDAGSFIVINTLMLGALGVFDLFWWSLMASFLDYSSRPAAVLGIGLGANVLGIFAGGLVGQYMLSTPDGQGEITLLAFTIVFIGLAVLPLVNGELSRLFHRHVFLVNLQPVTITPPAETRGDEPMVAIITPDPMEVLREMHQLTEREVEVVGLLCRGYTYRAISETLGITDHTTKFHAKNIYQKLQVNNKMELIKIITPLINSDFNE